MRSVESQSSRLKLPIDAGIALCLYRTGIILLAFLLLVMIRSAGTKGIESNGTYVDVILGLWCLSHAANILFLRKWHSLKATRIQVGVDLCVVLALIWSTGGVGSVFLPVLLAIVLATSTVFGLQKAMLMASSATLVLTAMTISESFGWSLSSWLGLNGSEEQDSVYVASYLIGQGIAIHSIAFLGSWLCERLRKAVRINDLIVENIGEGILVLNERGRLSLLNEKALEILGYPQQSDWHNCAPEDLFRRKEDQELRKILTSSQSGSYQVEWTCGRSEKIPLLVRLTEVAAESNKKPIVVVHIRDLTLERRAVEAEASLAHLEEIEDLALGLVHEIRNPLASIRGCVQEIGAGHLNSAQLEKVSKIVIRESDRLDRTVNGFLEYSRTVPTELLQVDLLSCLKEVCESLEARSDAESIKLNLKCDIESAIFSCQRDLIYQVFSNLGINAIEAMDGKGEITFSLSRSSRGGFGISVEDDGPGMPEDVKRRVFNPYFTTKAREGGLGLALVARIIHAHGGSIEVDSQLGNGTCFRLWLPEQSEASLQQAPRSVLGVAV